MNITRMIRRLKFLTGLIEIGPGESIKVIHEYIDYLNSLASEGDMNALDRQCRVILEAFKSYSLGKEAYKIIDEEMYGKYDLDKLVAEVSKIVENTSPSSLRSWELDTL